MAARRIQSTTLRKVDRRSAECSSEKVGRNRLTLDACGRNVCPLAAIDGPPLIKH